MSSYGFVTSRLVSRRASDTYGLLILPAAEAMPGDPADRGLKGEHKGSWEKALEPSSGELCQPQGHPCPSDLLSRNIFSKARCWACSLSSEGEQPQTSKQTAYLCV